MGRAVKFWGEKKSLVSTAHMEFSRYTRNSEIQTVALCHVCFMSYSNLCHELGEISFILYMLSIQCILGYLNPFGLELIMISE